MAKTKAERTSAAIERMIYDFNERNIGVNIQVFATFTEAGRTVGMTRGSGDLYSRLGYIREWIIRDNEQIRQSQRQDMEPPAEREDSELT